MPEPGLHRQQTAYWSKLVDLKLAAIYVGLYRDALSRWVTGFGIVRAIASSVSIGAWAVWREHAFVWASIIACAQVLDALQNVVPVTKRHKAAAELAIVLDDLFINALLEWESIYAGRCTDLQIAKKLHRLRQAHHKAESQRFREGLREKHTLFVRAEVEADAFFRNTDSVLYREWRLGNEASRFKKDDG